MGIHVGKRSTKYAIWFGPPDWVVAGRECVGGKESDVVSVQFSVPRDPPKGYEKAPNNTNLRELELSMTRIGGWGD